MRCVTLSRLGQSLRFPPPPVAQLAFPSCLVYIALLCYILLLFCGHNPSDMSDSSSNSDMDVTSPSRGRKRARNVQAWKKTVTKVKRNSGKAYVSRASNKAIAARVIGPPCRDDCFGKVTREGVEAIFKAFWELGNYGIQNSYLQKMVKVQRVKRKRTAEEVSRRSSTYVYNVTFANVQCRVCREGFLAIHGLSEHRVKSALKKLTCTAMPTADQRGRHTPHNKVGGTTAVRVREHIGLLPAMSSHYSRAKSPHRRYFDSSLTTMKMYDLYVTWMRTTYPEEERVTFHYYRDVFTKEFNISFQPPSNDTCTTCDTFNTSIKNNENNQTAADEYRRQKDVHTELARKAFNLMKSYRTNDDPDLRAVCLDLQQTLPTPRLSSSVAYYKRKLWTYNLCIHDIKKNKSSMYVWDETTAKRGSVEIASCLKHWVQREYAKEDFDKLVVFSDNCSGQNKNINVVLCHLYELHCKRMIQIEHVFLVSGHSFMACDRAFGIIEKKIRRTGNIYTPGDYCEIITDAVTNGYDVIPMDQSSFLNFDELQKYVTKRKAPASNFKSARKFLFDVRYKEGYRLKGDYEDDQENISEVRVMPGKGAYAPSKFNLSSVTLKPKYTAPLTLNKEKVNDLESLTSLMPLDKAKFFLDIVKRHRETATQVAEETSDDPDDDGLLLDYC